MTHLDILIHVLPLFFLIFVANIQVLPLAQTYLHPNPYKYSHLHKHIFILIYKSNYIQEYEIIVFFFFFLMEEFKPQ